MDINKILEIKKNKTLLNGFLFSSFSFVNKGMGFILLILLANFISPEEYGYLSLYTTFIMFISYIIGLSTNGYQSITYFKDSKEETKKDTTCILTISVISFIVIHLVLLAGKGIFPQLTNLSFPILQLGICISFFNFFYLVNLEFLRIKEQVYKYGYLSCGHTLFNFILSLIFVISFSLNWKGRIYAEGISSIIFFIVAIVYFHQQRLITFKGINPSRFKRIIFWGLPLIPHLAANWIKQGGDRYIIENYHTMEEVGLFSFALNLTNIIIMIGVAFNASNSVDIYKTLSINVEKEKIHSLIKRKEKTYLLIYLFTSTIIVVSCSIIIPYLLPQYANSISYFWILGIYGFLQCAYFIYCNYLFYYKKNKYIMYITFTSSILHLILSILLTKYSLYLTALIYVISHAYILLTINHISNKAIKQNLYESNY